MKLELKNNSNLRSLFPIVEGPDYSEDRVDYYDVKKLMEWEERYKELLNLLEDRENQGVTELLFELAEEGYPEARWLLSDMYLKGERLPESFEKAVEWDRRAKYAEGLLHDKGLNK